MASLTEAWRRVREAFVDARRFLRTGLWERDYTRHHGPQWLLLRQLQVVALAVRGMRQARIHLQAAYLTVITLLSIVPSLAVIFSVFEAFGGIRDIRQRLREFIYENIAVGAQGDFTHWLDKLLSNIHGAAIGGIGFAILVFAAVRLLVAMEQTFNQLWGVRSSRSLHARFVIYWVLLTLGPLVLASSLTGTAALQGWISKRLVFPGSALIFGFVPALLVVAALTFLYVIIPNTRVRVKHALVGAVVAGAFLEGAKLGYAWIARHLFAYNALYGSLGAIPVFIIWVNIAWLLVLLGCLITFANQNVRTLRQELRAGEASEAFRELVAVRLVLDVSGAFVGGQPPPEPADLASRAEVPVRLVQDLLGVLTDAGLLREATPDSDRVEGYVPARIPEDITLEDVVSALRDRRGVSLETTEDEAQAALRSLLARGEAASDEVLRAHDYLTLARRFSSEQGGPLRAVEDGAPAPEDVRGGGPQ